MNRYSYLAYGLGIRSALPMPELLSDDSSSEKGDVVVRYGTLDPPRPEEMDTFYFVRADEAGIYYFIKEVGGVLVRQGCEIVIDPLPGGVAKGFRFLVMGIAMGLLLHQRGALTLHASAVSLEGGVAAFTGWKGMGKSTMAAALHAHGHPVVTDDLLVLDLAAEQVVAIPGFPSLKLWPEAVAASFGEDPEQLPRVHPDATKRTRSVRDGFRQAPLPLRGIYVLDYLDEDAPEEIVPMAPRDAYIELVRHSFALRLLNEQGTSALHAQLCARLVRQVPVRLLKRKRALGSLARLARQVEEDLYQNGSAVRTEASVSYAL